MDVEFFDYPEKDAVEIKESIEQSILEDTTFMLEAIEELKESTIEITSEWV